MDPQARTAGGGSSWQLLPASSSTSVRLSTQEKLKRKHDDAKEEHSIARGTGNGREKGERERERSRGNSSKLEKKEKKKSKKIALKIS